MTAFGWTIKQYALAISLLDRKPVSVKEFLDLKRDYLKKFKDDPVENLTIYSPDGDTRPADYETAILIFEELL